MRQRQPALKLLPRRRQVAQVEGQHPEGVGGGDNPLLVRDLRGDRQRRARGGDGPAVVAAHPERQREFVERVGLGTAAIGTAVIGG